MTKESLSIALANAIENAESKKAEYTADVEACRRELADRFAEEQQVVEANAAGFRELFDTLKAEFNVLVYESDSCLNLSYQDRRALEFVYEPAEKTFKLISGKQAAYIKIGPDPKEIIGLRSDWMYSDLDGGGVKIVTRIDNNEDAVAFLGEWLSDHPVPENQMKPVEKAKPPVDIPVNEQTSSNPPRRRGIMGMIFG